MNNIVIIAIIVRQFHRRFTITSGSISSVSLVTRTGEAPRSVGTCSIRVTVVSGSISTLINI